MSCDIYGGCRICPGMWIAAALLAVMAVQSFVSRPKNEASSAKADSIGTLEQPSTGSTAVDSKK